MSTGTTLQELARQVRRDTLEVLRAARPEWLTFAPSGTSNHIVWHAGHALWLGDLLCVELLTGRSELPPGWAGTFGMRCRPPQQTSEWPSRDKLDTLLQQQLQRVLELLETTSDELLAKPADLSRGPASVSARIIHGLHDEAKHCGEMYLLLKLCRAELANSSASQRRPLLPGHSTQKLKRESQRQVALLREIFGDPFAPPKVEPKWLRWSDGAVLKVARDIYNDPLAGDYRRLRRSLKSAGCDDGIILDHCSSRQHHVLGCWLLDVLIGVHWPKRKPAGNRRGR